MISWWMEFRDLLWRKEWEKVYYDHYIRELPDAGC